MRQCDAERAGVNWGTRWRMKKMGLQNFFVVWVRDLGNHFPQNFLKKVTVNDVTTLSIIEKSLMTIVI